jgi:parallel beta-helix repeat protein
MGNKIAQNTENGVKCLSSSPELTENLILNNTKGIYCTDQSNISIRDSQILDSSIFDVHLDKKTKLTAFNTTLNNSKVMLDDSASSIEGLWYLYVKADDEKDRPVENATISFYDSKDELIHEVETKEDGSVEKVVIKSYEHRQCTLLTQLKPQKMDINNPHSALT